MKIILIRCDKCTRNIVEGPDELLTLEISSGVESEKKTYHFCRTRCLLDYFYTCPLPKYDQ